MTLLLEEPLPIVMIGLLIVAILGGVWIRSGRNWLIYALVAVIVLMAVMLLLERWVDTYREQVDATLRQCAAAVENNDMEAVLGHVQADAGEIRLQARNELPRYRFKKVVIARNLEIAVDSQHDPPQAVAEFNVILDVTLRRGMADMKGAVRFVEVTFQLDDDGQWRVIRYRHNPPMRRFQNQQ